MKKIFDFVRVLALQSQTARLRRSDAQAILMAKDLAKLRADYMALLKLSKKGRLDDSSFAVIKHLTVLMQQRDYAAYRHGVRVAKLAVLIAHQLQMDNAFCAMIELATPLHDIGFVAIPNPAVCATDGHGQDAATDLIWHTRLGQLILASEDALLSFAADIAAAHHEHFDGNGYPNGLLGENIPVAARIVAVADYFENLLCGSQYQPPMSAREAYQKVMGEYGSRFDPQVVRGLDKVADDFAVMIENDPALQRPAITPRTKIVLVNDSPETRRLVRDLLGNEFETLEADDGASALAIVRAKQPDIVVIDVMIQGRPDGLLVLNVIKADPALVETKVIMVTARGQEHTGAADAYFTKPFSPIQLASYIRKISAK